MVKVTSESKYMDLLNEYPLLKTDLVRLNPKFTFLVTQMGKISLWEANLEEPASEGGNKFKGAYYQGYLTELEKTSNAEDFVECSLTFGINGAGVKGDVTVTAEQQEIANYVFADTNKKI
jgi:hypothetical protein